MKRALHLLDEFRDIVQGKPGLEIAEVTSGNFEALPLLCQAPPGKPEAQCLVDDLAEGTSQAPRLRFKFGRDIVVQGERRSHAVML